MNSSPSMIKWFFLFLFLLFVYHVREVFPPFIVGGIIAYLLNPLVKYVCRKIRWMKAGIAIGIIYFGTIGIISLLCVHFGPTLVEQFEHLFEQRHEMVGGVINQISTQAGLGLDVEKTTADILNSVENAGQPTEIMHFGGLISKSLLAILVCTVSSIYLILDSSRVGKFFLRFVPEDRRDMVVTLSSQMNVMLSKYVSGQLILIFIMSCVSWAILTLFGIKFALLVGILCGFFEVIPVLGPLIAIGLATIVGCTQLHFDLISLGIPALLFIARQIEDYVVVPKVIGHAVELHPLAVIFAVLVGETMAGALGMLIAIPVAASIKVILDFCYPPQPDDHPKAHGGILAWIVTKFKGRPSDRHAPTQTEIDSSQKSLAAEWASNKNEVRNEDFAEQTLEINQSEKVAIKESAVIKLEEKKMKEAAIKLAEQGKEKAAVEKKTEPEKAAKESTNISTKAPEKELIPAKYEEPAKAVAKSAAVDTPAEEKPQAKAESKSGDGGNHKEEKH